MQVCMCPGGPSTKTLQQVDLAITDEESCRNAYSNQRGALIDERVLCASKPGKDACQVSYYGLKLILCFPKVMVEYIPFRESPGYHYVIKNICCLGTS